jgi:hypothetical protein
MLVTAAVPATKVTFYAAAFSIGIENFQSCTVMQLGKTK